MVCESCCHRRGSLLPFAPRRWLWNGNAQRLMRAYEIEGVWLFFDNVHLMISKCGVRLGRCVWSD
jgi:hypothetical protein